MGRKHTFCRREIVVSFFLYLFCSKSKNGSFITFSSSEFSFDPLLISFLDLFLLISSSCERILTLNGKSKILWFQTKMFYAKVFSFFHEEGCWLRLEFPNDVKMLKVSVLLLFAKWVPFKRVMLIQSPTKKIKILVRDIIFIIWFTIRLFFYWLFSSFLRKTSIMEKEKGC